jgi:hypothetical protein
MIMASALSAISYHSEELYMTNKCDCGESMEFVSGGHCYRYKCPQCGEEETLTADTCMVCATPLSIPGGYAGTDMCGVCATGEAEMLEERGETW